MPTPNPIMVASVGAMLGTATMCPSSPMIAKPSASPMTALMMGRNMAMRVPNDTARMMTAAMRPMTVLESVFGLDSVAPTVPPAAT